MSFVHSFVVLINLRFSFANNGFNAPNNVGCSNLFWNCQNWFWTVVVTGISPGTTVQSLHIFTIWCHCHSLTTRFCHFKRECSSWVKWSRAFSECRHDFLLIFPFSIRSRSISVTLLKLFWIVVVPLGHWFLWICPTNYHSHSAHLEPEKIAQQFFCVMQI